MAIVRPLFWNGSSIAVAASTDVLGIGISEVDAISLTNANASAIVIGRAVYISASASCNLAQANAAGTREVVGLVADTSIAASAVGKVQTSGVFTATTTQWDVVTGQVGGLTPNSTYYLSAATAGALTTTAPSTAGQFVYRVGKAISTTQMDIDPGIIDIAL